MVYFVAFRVYAGFMLYALAGEGTETILGGEREGKGRERERGKEGRWRKIKMLKQKIKMKMRSSLAASKRGRRG